MNKVRLKQRKLFKVLKSFVIFAALFLFAYIGAKPIIAEYNQTLALVINYICDVFVVVVLLLLFAYYSKYGKCESFLTQIENEINDNGYYFTSRSERDSEAYINVVSEDLTECDYSVSRNIEINEFDFAIKAVRKKEFFYLADVRSIDKNDVLAHLDCVIYDITAKNLRRKGNAVLCFVTDTAEEDAISLSKMITPLDKKELIKVAIAICELSTGNVYFLGNVQTKCQQMIANFVMNCDLPIKEQYIHKDKLQFQYDLAEKMKDFNLKDFKNDNFFIR